METKTLKLFVVVLLLLTNGYAQNQPVFESYSWESQPVYKVSSSETEEIIALKDKTITEFYYEEDGSLVEYFLHHKALLLNSDNQIEDNNKVYLPHSSASNLLINKARVVTKDGTVLELDESKILTANNEETGRQYKYFAFEGIEKGSVIEYYYVLKRSPRYRGNRMTFQTDYPKTNVSFDLYAPKNLYFKFKSYNGLVSVERDTMEVEKNHWNLNIAQLGKLEREDLSPYNASKRFVVYKLDRNTVGNKKNLISYATVSQNLYGYYYAELDPKVLKLLNTFINDANIDRTNEEIALRSLDNYLKTNIYIANTSGEKLQDIKSIASEKVANERGFTLFYISLLRVMNVKHELVFSSDRRELKFDKEFEANNFLDEALLYFPEYKTFVAPSDIESRYGYPPAYYTDNYGLFIKEVKVGEFKSGLGRIKYIKPVPAEKSYDKMIVNISFDPEDISNTHVKMKRSFSGYYAMDMQPYIPMAKQENIDDLLEGMAKNINKNVDIHEKSLENGEDGDFGVKPLIFNLNFSSEDFVEKAGKKYLFKIGQIIGPQMELYQEKKRVLTLENEFERVYYRTLEIAIPDGYSIANLDDLKIDNSYSADGEVKFSFKSVYKIDNNRVTITADEYYRKNIVETDIYEDYRKVINSAADFNKIVLILEPTKVGE